MARAAAPSRRRPDGGTVSGCPHRADAGHPRRDRPPRPRRHHGRHPELQERRDDRLRRARGAGRPRPVLPGPAARPRQLATPARPTARSASSSRPSRPTTSSRSCSSGRRTSSTRVSLTYPEIDGVGGKGAALRTIFEIAAALEVQALVVVDSRPALASCPSGSSCSPGPILKGGYDFVAPLYARYKYDGTITNTVTYPLTRALYGHRIRQPIGGDFGVSRRPRPALPRARRLDATTSASSGSTSG